MINSDDAFTKKLVKLNNGGRLNDNIFTRKQVGLNDGREFNGDNSLTDIIIRFKSKIKDKIKDKIRDKSGVKM